MIYILTLHIGLQKHSFDYLLVQNSSYLLQCSTKMVKYNLYRIVKFTLKFYKHFGICSSLNRNVIILWKLSWTLVGNFNKNQLHLSQNYSNTFNILIPSTFQTNWQNIKINICIGVWGIKGPYPMTYTRPPIPFKILNSEL